MSAFGHGTFKQEVMDYIDRRAEDSGLDVPDKIAATLEIIAYMVREDYYKTLNNINIKEEALKNAKRQLVRSFGEHIKNSELAS